MKRKSPSASDLGIVPRVAVQKVTVAMPKGGYKNTRVVTRKVTLASVGSCDDDVTPRMLRRR